MNSFAAPNTTDKYTENEIKLHFNFYFRQLCNVHFRLMCVFVHNFGIVLYMFMPALKYAWKIEINSLKKISMKSYETHPKKERAYHLKLNKTKMMMKISELHKMHEHQRDFIISIKSNNCM